MDTIFILSTAILVSIDAFVGGFALALDKKLNAVRTIVIGLITFIMCVPAALLGGALGKVLGGYVELIGGAVFLIIGVRNIFSFRKELDDKKLRPENPAGDSAGDSDGESASDKADKALPPGFSISENESTGAGAEAVLLEDSKKRTGENPGKTAAGSAAAKKRAAGNRGRAWLDVMLIGAAVGLDAAIANLSISMMGNRSIWVCVVFAAMHIVFVGAALLLTKLSIIKWMRRFFWLPGLIMVLVAVYKIVMFFI